MKTIKIFLLMLLSVILAWIINYYFTGEIISRFLYLPQSFIMPFAIILLILQAFFIFAILNLFIYSEVDKITYRIIWICYFSILLFILFGRPNSFRKINLNPIAIISSLNGLNGILLFLLNLAFFIPIGYVFRYKNIMTVLIVMIPVEFCIETIQYVFKLGIFDIDDIIINIVGILIGYLVAKNKDLIKVKKSNKLANDLKSMN